MEVQPREKRLFDVVVVPAWRPVASLGPVVAAAYAVEARLVVLCSGHASARETVELADRAGVTGLALELPRGYTHPLLKFSGSAHPAAADARFTDVRIKRNLGILLARMNGWERLFFHDDDHQLDAGQLERAASSLDTHRAGCFYAEDFPDNSVVRHAERLTGRDPGVSLSIGSAAVRIDDRTSFFPEVYNEDWLFLHDSLPGDVLALEPVPQLPYDPFADPARARSEEFGDILAEGLVRFREAGLSPGCATEADWADVLADRARLIDDTADRLRAAGGGHRPGVAAALCSLRAAREQLDATSASSLASWVRMWRNDTDVWHGRLAGLPRADSLTDAVGRLGLADMAIPFAAR